MARLLEISARLLQEIGERSVCIDVRWQSIAFSLEFRRTDLIPCAIEQQIDFA